MAEEQLTGKKILVVEDDFSSRLYLNKILERSGAIVLNAGDGIEAVKIASENNDICIILMDIQLPFMDGYSATRKIKEAGHKSVVIAQTAYGLSGDMENIIASGFDDYIIKPIYSTQLISKIINLINNR